MQCEFEMKAVLNSLKPVEGVAQKLVCAWSACFCRFALGVLIFFLCRVKALLRFTFVALSRSNHES
jgi:hypothetical protein